ncbi:MAG TPA: DCC1-like thiol-disulfide oxidoreductase family protein [Gemmatimonadaceae bacterium]|nr:DCC1-like thiol-disulfide oxidoreductase family protein [Gemmatimonadaceae bacterium]
MAITGSTSFRSSADVLEVAGGGPILLYDGTCGFCARSVQFVLRHEPPSGVLRFARLEGAIGQSLRARYPELASIDSLIWYEPATATTPTRILLRSRGALRVARYLGGFWAALGALGMVVPRRLSDAVYAWIARHRRELAAAACIVPTPSQRARFID